MADFPT